MSLPTTYQLYIHLRRPCRIQAGRLPTHRLPAGWYIYTGSARQHLDARIERHLRRQKTRRWHIDWLLTRADARVVHVTLHHEAECALNARMGGDSLIPGFGASDCRAGCISHLRYLGEQVPHPVPPSQLTQRNAGLKAFRRARR
ncbi:hypothetical protein M911_09520 [Ectothiorhodospira haloalkaliphila]|uniref:Endonuclease III n=1 Tax=Ectothiorhodospira haloalkaliphila TaxID=421628 RepID=W8KHS5_9GAMM|nr:GIY-YIG nuclease family protein [Ectothiorhodospira haloalkaliphila]AHK79344.1 hypothetical protein M911_09520 [Ectothiorhodospira haloalkaliphila]